MCLPACCIAGCAVPAEPEERSVRTHLHPLIGSKDFGVLMDHTALEACKVVWSNAPHLDEIDRVCVLRESDDDASGHLVTVHDTGEITVWNTDRGARAYRPSALIVPPGRHRVTSVLRNVVLRGQPSFLVGTADGLITAYARAGYSVAFTLLSAPIDLMVGFNSSNFADNVRGRRPSAPWTHVLCVSKRDSAVDILRVGDLSLVATLKHPVGHNVVSAAVHRDRAFVVCSNGACFVWRLNAFPSLLTHFSLTPQEAITVTQAEIWPAHGRVFLANAHVVVACDWNQRFQVSHTEMKIAPHKARRQRLLSASAEYFGVAIQCLKSKETKVRVLHLPLEKALRKATRVATKSHKMRALRFESISLENVPHDENEANDTLCLVGFDSRWRQLRRFELPRCKSDSSSESGVRHSVLFDLNVLDAVFMRNLMSPRTSKIDTEMSEVPHESNDEKDRKGVETDEESCENVEATRESDEAIRKSGKATRERDEATRESDEASRKRSERDEATHESSERRLMTSFDDSIVGAGVVVARDTVGCDGCVREGEVRVHMLLPHVRRSALVLRRSAFSQRVEALTSMVAIGDLPSESPLSSHRVLLLLADAAGDLFVVSLLNGALLAHVRALSRGAVTRFFRAEADVPPIGHSDGDGCDRSDHVVFSTDTVDDVHAINLRLLSASKRSALRSDAVTTLTNTGLGRVRHVHRQCRQLRQRRLCAVEFDGGALAFVSLDNGGEVQQVLSRQQYFCVGQWLERRRRDTDGADTDGTVTGYVDTTDDGVANDLGTVDDDTDSVDDGFEHYHGALELPW
ncbi:MAG: hypothetical protein MHM6MM_006600, partial [Cercozoa sp. M6MM]